MKNNVSPLFSQTILERREKQMSQQTMFELIDQSKEVSITPNDHSNGSDKIKNAISEIFSTFDTTPGNIPVFNEVEKEKNINGSFDKNEQTVFFDLNRVKNPYKNHRLIVLSGDSIDRTYPIDHPKMMIGRDKSSHIRINQKSVSLYHAMICIKENECILKDLNSKNGTIVNGHHVQDSLKLQDGDKIQIGPTIFTFVHENLSHSLRTQKRIWKNRITKGALAIAGIIIMTIFIFFNQINTGDSQPLSSIDQKKPDSNNVSDNIPGKEKITNSPQTSMTQQASSPFDVQSVSQTEIGLQLAEKALHHYINGDIAISVKMLEETLRLDLPNDSPLKAKVLAIRDRVVMIYNLYEEGLKQYRESNMGQAIGIWSQALKADREIVGQTNSFFATQIASYTGDIFYKMARQAYDKGDIEQAREMCSQTFRAQPSNKGCLEIMNTISKDAQQ